MCLYIICTLKCRCLQRPCSWSHRWLLASDVVAGNLTQDLWLSSARP